MSVVEVELASLLLSQFFGADVAKVAEILAQQDLLSLHDIVKESELTREQCQLAMVGLIRHGLVRYRREGPGNVTHYALNTKQVLLLSSYTNIISAFRMDMGNVAAVIMETLLLNGQLCLSELVVKTFIALQDSSDNKNTITPTIRKMVEWRYLQRADKMVVDEGDEEDEVDDDDDEVASLSLEYTLPEEFMDSESAAAIVEKEGEELNWRDLCGQFPDRRNMWRANLRQAQQLRKEIIFGKFVEKHYGSLGVLFTQSIFHLTRNQFYNYDIETSHVSAQRLFQSMTKKKPELDYACFKQFICMILHDTSSILVEGVGGESYSFSMYQAMIKIFEEAVLSSLEEQFDTLCSRIFNVLCDNKCAYMEQEHIEEAVLGPVVDTKKRIYNMFCEGYLALHEIPKSSEHVPSKTIYLWGVEKERVAYKLSQDTYVMLKNTLLGRQNSEKEKFGESIVREGNAMMETYASVDLPEELDTALLQEFQDGLKEVFGSDTLYEKLGMGKEVIQCLEMSEIELDEALFVYQQYVKHECQQRFILSRRT